MLQLSQSKHFRCVLCHARITLGDGLSINSNDDVLDFDFGFDVPTLVVAGRQNARVDIADDDGGDVVVVLKFCRVKCLLETWT